MAERIERPITKYFLNRLFKKTLRFGRMNKIKKVLSAWMLVACVLPVAAQYPVIPDSVKERGAKQEAEFDRNPMRHGKKPCQQFWKKQS